MDLNWLKIGNTFNRIWNDIICTVQSQLGHTSTSKLINFHWITNNNLTYWPSNSLRIEWFFNKIVGWIALYWCHFVAQHLIGRHWLTRMQHCTKIAQAANCLINVWVSRFFVHIFLSTLQSIAYAFKALRYQTQNEHDLLTHGQGNRITCRFNCEQLKNRFEMLISTNY